MLSVKKITRAPSASPRSPVSSFGFLSRLLAIAIFFSATNPACSAESRSRTYDELSRAFSGAIEKIQRDPRDTKASKECQDIYDSTPEEWRIQLNYDRLVQPDNGFFAAGLRTIADLLAAGQDPGLSLRSRLADAIWEKWQRLPSSGEERYDLLYIAPETLMLLEDDRGLELYLEAERSYNAEDDDGWNAGSPIEKFAALKEKYDRLAAEKKLQGMITSFPSYAHRSALYELCRRRKAAGAPEIVTRSKETGVPAKVLKAAEHLASLSRARGNPFDPSAYDEFMEKLSRLASDSDETANAWAAREEGNLMSAKLIHIANDYRKRPEIYREFFEKFFVDKNETSLRPMVSSPMVDSKPFCTEEYRLPVELASLSPRTNREFDLSLQAAALILSDIGDKRSLISLRFLFSSFHNGTHSQDRLREAVAYGLVGMPSRESLSILLDCLSLELDRENTKRKIPGANQWSEPRTIEDVRQLLSHFGANYSPDPGKFRAWKNLVEEVPPDSLSTQQKEALEEIREIIRSVEKKASETKPQVK